MHELPLPSSCAVAKAFLSGQEEQTPAPGGANLPSGLHDLHHDPFPTQNVLRPHWDGTSGIASVLAVAETLAEDVRVDVREGLTVGELEPVVLPDAERDGGAENDVVGELEVVLEED